MLSVNISVCLHKEVPSTNSRIGVISYGNGTSHHLFIKRWVRDQLQKLVAHVKTTSSIPSEKPSTLEVASPVSAL